jgi:hypothetical protein
LNGVMTSWQTFWRLRGCERGIVLESVAGLTASWLGLRLAGFRRWKSVLAWLSPSERPVSSAENADQIILARRIARLEEAAARRHLFHPNCLEQSMVLWWLLRLRGISSELRVGGRRQGGQFEAHAWVELDGIVLSGGGDGHLHFVPFDGPLTNMETPHN